MSLPLDQARALAERIRAALSPMCSRIDIAGSIRRARPVCGDIDIVCQAQPHMRSSIIDLCKRGGTLAKHGEQYAVINLPSGVQLDLWFAHGGGGDLFAPEPPNYGILLLSRTGSAAHNIQLATRAKSLGLHFHPHKGVMKGERIVASVNESLIFQALNLPFIEPEKREVQP